MRMKKVLIASFGAGMALVYSLASAQFIPGQVLTATQLNAALASPTVTGGTINGSTIGGANPKPGTFTNLNVTGSLTATGLVTLPSLAAQAANTIIANVTGSSANPTAVALPSCSAANSALQYTSGSSIGCGTSFALTSGNLGQFASTTSAQLAAIISNETGTGVLVFGTAPTLIGASITAGAGLSYSNPQFSVSDTSSSNKAVVQFQKNGASVWNIGNSSTAGTFALDRFVSGAYVDSPITASNSTGAITMVDGVTNTPVSGSTGSFTALSSSGATSVAYTSPVFAINDTSGTGFPVFYFQKSGANVWGLTNNSATGALTINRYVSGTLVDNPISIANGTGIVSMADGLTVTGQISATGTTGLGTPTSIGTSVYPTIVAPVSTTATTTNGLATVTVTSAAGLTINMGAYPSSVFGSSCSTPGAAFVNPYITNISGTTVTLSCPAVQTNGTPIAVQFGQARYSSTSSILANDLGAQSLKIGAASQNNYASWLNQVSTGQDFRPSTAAQIISPPGGGYGLLVGARASDANSGAPPFPIQSFLYLDNWANAGYSAENVYLQDNLAAATAGHGPHIQMEQSINSLWGSPPAEDPFTINATNQTIAHRYDCGTGQATTSGMNGCTSAMDIVPNPETFENGIVIANNAIDTGGGTRQGNALAMPLMVGFTWFSAASTYSAATYSPSAGVLDFLVPAGGQYQFIVNGSTVGNITGTGINGTAIGQTTPAAAAVTNLAVSGTITGVGGRLLNVQTFTSSGTYTPTTGATKGIACGTGGGGAGGGAPATGASQASIGGGGSAGAFGCIYISSGLTSQTVTIGAGGVGASGANGGAGGQTSFGSLMVLPGGPGGGTAGPTAGPSVGFGTGQSAAPSGSGTFLYQSKGAYSTAAIIASATSFASGTGANSNFGAGGPNVAGSTGTGTAASGYGAGGSGAGALASQSAQTGGAGTAGLITVYEYQ